MNYTVDHAAVRRDLPAIWEVLRAASGLVAVITLVAIAIVTALLPETRGLEPAAAPASGARQLLPTPDVPVPSSGPRFYPRTMVFYLVATPEEELLADLSENVDDADLYRGYRILYVATDAEIEIARQTVLDYIVAENAVTQVRVVDLRGVN